MTPERDKRQMAYNDSMASKDESLLQYTEDGDTLELDTLESHLWEAADILRGSIGAADYKNYIFGLLFLKRINDRFEEETLEIAEELTGDDEEPDEDLLEQIRDDRDLHEEFWVPERARIIRSSRSQNLPS
jgi:type I restriction enzyme M protein